MSKGSTMEYFLSFKSMPPLRCYCKIRISGMLGSGLGLQDSAGARMLHCNQLPKDIVSLLQSKGPHFRNPSLF